MKSLIFAFFVVFAFGDLRAQTNVWQPSAVHVQPETTRPQRFHIVRQGETLSGIARDYYGSAGQWRKMFEANRGTLKDANTVRAGTKLIMPE